MSELLRLLARFARFTEKRTYNRQPIADVSDLVLLELSSIK